MENASMAFDHDTLKPTYRFQMGIPGSSYAFEIAGRLGLPGSIIESARAKIGEERGKLDRLIIQLEADLEKARRLLGEAEIKESRSAGLAKLYREKLELLEVRLDRIFRKAEESHSLHVSLGCLQESIRVLSLREKIRHSLGGPASW